MTPSRRRDNTSLREMQSRRLILAHNEPRSPEHEVRNRACHLIRTSVARLTDECSWRVAPIAVLAYLAFAAFVSLGELTLVFLGPRDLREKVLPILGWSIAIPYMASIYFVREFCLRRDDRMRVAMIALLIVAIGLGFVDLFVQGVQRDSDNPYTQLTPWRFISEIVVPAFWILILMSRRVRHFAARNERLT